MLVLEHRVAWFLEAGELCVSPEQVTGKQMVFSESLVGQTGVTGRLVGQTMVTGRLVGQTMVTGQFHLSCRDSSYAETEVKEAVRMRNCSTILRAAWHCRVFRSWDIKITVCDIWRNTGT